MTYSLKEFRTRDALVAYSNELVRAAGQEGTPISLVVPSNGWVWERKLQVMDTRVGGVSVQTYAAWLGGLWDTFGDGSRLVSTVQRVALARPLLAELFEAQPSFAMVREFGAFLAQMVGMEDAPHGALSATEQQIVALVGRYEAALAQAGLVEQAQVEDALLESGAPVDAVVLEEPFGLSARSMRFLEELGKGVPVTVLGRSILAGDRLVAPGAAPELRELASKLYTGEGGVRAAGRVMAGEAHGAHIEGALLAELVEKLVEQGAALDDVSIVFANAADSYPHVQDKLVRSGIAFTCSFGVPSYKTALGNAVQDLLRVQTSSDEGASYLALAGLAASPYAGIEAADARALHMRWRMRATSLHEQRMRDIRDGFGQGNATSTQVRERLEPLAALLDMPLADAVRTMFEHARAARGALAPALVDDERAADAILDYLEEVEALGAVPNADDIAQVSVPLERAYGGSGDAAAAGVQLIGARDLGLEKRPYVVLANLDSAHHPMASRPGSFDVLLSKFGLQREDTRALQERCLLLDAIGAAREGFVFYRVCHDREGSESCQSALWDELVTAYATPEDADNKVAQLPRALEDVRTVVRLAEVQVFEQGDRAQHVQIVRGELEDGAMNHQLVQYSSGDAIPFSPTALEDYYRCPYRWFTSRRVGYNGMDNSFTGSAQGTLAHGFFDAFYRELRALGHERVTEQNLEEALELAESVFDAYLERGLNKPRTGLFLHTEMDRLACDEVRSQVLEFIKRDAQFLPGFAPTYFELELGRGTGSTLMYAGVPVRGKVDRVDVDAQGRAVIIDYKLSKLNAGYGLDAGGELPGRIQTDIYAALVQRHFELLGEDVRVVGSVYRSYSGNMLRGVYAEGIDWGPVEVSKQKSDALPSSEMNMNYDEYLDRVEHEVSQCVERLVAGDIEPRPRAKGVCEYCRALTFCPRREA